MEVKVIENEPTRLLFQLVGSDHTFCNALKKELVETKGVDVATYAIEHPQVGIPKMLIETAKGTKPQDALKAAVESLKKKNKEFSSAFSKAAK